jgi:hypothetical protein
VWSELDKAGGKSVTCKVLQPNIEPFPRAIFLRVFINPDRIREEK